MSEKASFLFDTGFGFPISKVTLEDAPVIVKQAFVHFVIAPVALELSQLKEGLGLCKILQLIEHFPQVMKRLFVLDTKSLPKSADLIDLFEIRYSADGSSDLLKEQDVAKNWMDFLEDVENGLIRK